MPKICPVPVERAETCKCRQLHHEKDLQLTCMHVVQGAQLFSPDGAVYLTVQSNGNLVLYNTAQEAASGPVPSAAVWSSGSTGNGHPAPYELIMQTV